MTQTNQPSAGAPGTEHALWYDGFPCVLAHEYHRLQGLLRNGQRYGAYYQAKDVIESTLKYVLLAACAWAKSANIEGREEGYEMALASKTPSLGMWVSFGRQMQDFFSQPRFRQGGMPAPLWTLLNRTVSWMDKNSLVHWRNEGIGHGALAFDDSPEFCEDLARVERIITEFYKRNADLFAMHTIVSGSTPLPGHANARSLREETGELALRLPALPDIPLFPFMVHIRHGVFFFDEVESRSLTRMINYPVGSDAIVSSPEVTGYYARLSDILSQSGLDIGRDVASGYLSEGESALLDRLNADEHYVSPRHLTAWLKDALGRHKKGAFLLTMARGCGKSTFSQKLSRLYKNPETLANDLDVRTYHFFRTQFDGLSEFKEGLEDQWAREYSEGGQTRMGRFRRFEHYERDAENLAVPPARQMALFLEAVLGEVRSSRGKRRILLVLDGLDEISDNDIWPYLACGDLLPEGVYLLLTCRSAGGEPLPAGFDARLDALGVCERRTFSTDDPDNLAFLRAYARARVPRAGEQELQQLLALSENRVLYLSMYCRLVQGGLSVRDLGHGQTAVARYIAELETRYGEARRALLHKLLLALCTFGEEEPLSLGEMAYLTGNGGVTLELVAMMNDLSPLLYTQRGYSVGGRRYAGVNRYRLVNASLADAVRTHFSAILPDFMSSLSAAALARAQDEAPMCDGQKLVLAHIADAASHVPGLPPFTCEQLGILAAFITRAYPLPMQRVFDLQRAQMTCMQAVQIGKALLDAKELTDAAAYAQALCRMGEIKSALGRKDEALCSFASAANALIAHGKDQCLLMLTVLLRQEQLRLSSGEFADEIGQKLMNIHKYIQRLQNGGHLHEDEKRPAALLDAEACIALCEQQRRVLASGALTSDFGYRLGHIFEALHHAEHAASVLLAQQDAPPSLILDLHAALSGCIAAYTTKYARLASDAPGPFTLSAAMVVHEEGLDAAATLIKREAITPLHFVAYGSKMPASAEQDARQIREADAAALQVLCDLYETLLTEGELPDTRPLADSHLRLAQLSENWAQKLSSFQRTYELYEELRKSNLLSPEDELKLHSAALGRAMYAAASDSYAPQPDNGETERLCLREARAKCAEALFVQSAEQNAPSRTYLHQFQQDSRILERSCRKQNNKNAADTWKKRRRTHARRFQHYIDKMTVQILMSMLSIYYLPILMVLTLFSEYSIAAIPLVCIAVLFSLRPFLHRHLKHTLNRQRPSFAFSTLIATAEILIFLMLAGLFDLLPRFNLSELSSYPALQEALSAITAFLRQLSKSSPSYAQRLLPLALAFGCSMFLVEGFTLHIYLRLKLRKVRRALAKLRDRLLGDPPDGH